MAGWNFAELWEQVAARFGDSPALIQGERRLTWCETDERANGLARYLLDAGADILAGRVRGRLVSTSRAQWLRTRFSSRTTSRPSMQCLRCITTKVYRS